MMRSWWTRLEGWGRLRAWHESSACNIWFSGRYGEERRESAEDKAARLVAAGLKAAGWQESALASRRKGDPVKMALAQRLRRETTMPLKSSSRVGLAARFYRAFFVP